MPDSSPPLVGDNQAIRHTPSPDSPSQDAPPHATAITRRTSLPIRQSPTTTPRLPSDSVRGISPPSKTLPPPLQSLLTSILNALKANTSSPPYTAQRLAELVLHPTKHYKTLPSFLRALDRVVCVSSPLSAFPLPVLATSSLTSTSSPSEAAHGHGSLLNGVPDPKPVIADAANSDVSGATLTPIPWLLRKKAEAEAKAQESAAAQAAAGNGDAAGEDETASPPDSPSSHALTPISPTHPPNPLTQELRAEAAAAAARGRGRDAEESDTVRGADPDTTSSSSVSSPPNNPSASSLSSSAQTTSAGTSLGQSITQGELLRQEQLSGSVPVPVGQSSSPHISTSDPTTTTTTGATGTEAVMAEGRGDETMVGTTATGDENGDGDDKDDDGAEEKDAEQPHTRGPVEVGVEDMGPQKEGAGSGGFDIEGAVGRRAEGERMVDVQEVEGGKLDVKEREKEKEKGKGKKTQEEGDGDGDLVIVDADGEMRDE